ncbi:UDP-N-acetylmuramoyl-tripeptide--D-alanyl-D-alanine ligase [Fundicoccus culcitae]|uniref:UDP-N-acetylmuramoyl-tripeptide--D-alanyl-D-alanine ligase n=1 Tax=Fundicoccus culcitae TaxID=2969821 RepID=A0ABY5P3V2_9LACT|nr:UDP-N-acetylmuramoyl-tripeptide--D-alanyl-D-alanine ligase [Fundicoccus culcitae]UUX33224.1 UDP-N-acetylmuramoyl-tripeptide--D-alanyl-D-alanine ligase [Fundicoccus culcitae]
MKALNLMEIVKAVHAIDYTTSDRQMMIEQVEFDSRKVSPNTLFVPLTGGTTDGHDYIDMAIEQGATATLWSRPESEAPSDKLAIILVDDTLQAMQDLAHYYRQLVNPIVVGITGSNGKTTAKDMTAMALSAKFKVHKTQGNYNNEIGLPYTLLAMPEDTDVCVLEMGMSNFGEIEKLSLMAEPNITAITLIGESHLEFLGSRRGIAQAKLEILKGMKEYGVFIFPANEPLISDEMPEINFPIYMRSFGFDKDDDVYAYDIVEEHDKTFFRTNVDPNVICMIPVIGAYNVSNALVALSIAEVLDVPIEQAIFQLAQFKLTANRLEWLETHQGAKLLNDAYNASPTSMRAILQTLSTVDTGNTGRKIAVLGDIRELGEKSEGFHRQLESAISPDAIDQVFLFGPNMRYLYEELQKDYSDDRLFYEPESHEALIEALNQTIQADDVVLVKSSFGVDLLQVVTALTGHSTK